jgi:hypothetical protein
MAAMSKGRRGFSFQQADISGFRKQAREARGKRFLSSFKAHDSG